MTSYQSIRITARSNTLTQRTIVSWHLTSWTTPFKRYATNTTNIALAVIAIRLRLSGIPSPLCYRMPVLDGDFHEVIALKNAHFQSAGTLRVVCPCVHARALSLSLSPLFCFPFPLFSHYAFTDAKVFSIFVQNISTRVEIHNTLSYNRIVTKQ